LLARHKLRWLPGIHCFSPAIFFFLLRLSSFLFHASPATLFLPP
jgi:hypothetical protein